MKHAARPERGGRYLVAWFNDSTRSRSDVKPVARQWMVKSSDDGHGIRALDLVGRKAPHESERLGTKRIFRCFTKKQPHRELTALGGIDSMTRR